jgi:hypothetical protein
MAHAICIYYYKFCMSKRAVLTFALTIGLFGFLSRSHGTTNSFRYQLDTKCGPAEYVGDLLGAPNIGRRFDVEDDDQGRRLRATSFQDGVETSENQFQYSGDNKSPDGWAVIVHRKTNGIVKATYGTNDCLKRLDYLTAAKQLTAYKTFEHRSNQVQVFTYDSHDTLRTRETRTYNKYNILVSKRAADGPGGGKFVEISYDESSGMETSREQFIGKSLQGRSECLYNAFGNLVARKDYDGAGRNIGGSDYSAGLVTNLWHAQKGDHTLSFRYSHDDNRWTKETQVYQDRTLVCVLTYERLSNGVPKRTFAKSPQGELWAEYFDDDILVIDPTGQPPHAVKAKFIKTGRWW